MFKAVVLACVVLACVYADRESRLENLNVDEITGNVRLLKSYANCFAEKGACPPDAKDYKPLISPAISSRCKECTPKEREIIKKVIVAMREQVPTEWNHVLDKYDPKRTLQPDLEAFLNSA